MYEMNTFLLKYHKSKLNVFAILQERLWVCSILLPYQAIIITIIVKCNSALPLLCVFVFINFNTGRMHGSR